MERSNSLKYFSRFYIGGILVGIAIGWLIVDPSNSAKNKLSSDILLIEGVLHMILLIIWGYQFRKPYQQISAGNKIQTAGYLHTLIGFIVTIGLMGVMKEETVNINSLLPPLSSALYTSLLGWLFGGEIASSGEQDNPSLEKMTSEIVLILQEYGRSLEDIHSQQISQCEQYYRDLADYFAHFNHLYQSLKNQTQQLSTNLSELSNNTVQMSHNMSVTAQSAQKVATSADEIAEYFQNTRILIEQLEALTQYVTSQRSH